MFATIHLVFFLTVAVQFEGLTLYQARKFAEAELRYRAALQKQPHDSDLRLGLARTLVELNRIPEALSELERVLASRPPSPGPTPETELEAGRLLRRLAEKRFRDLNRMDEGQAAISEIAGKRFEREGNFPAALARYREALQREPGRSGIQYLIGSALWKLREMEAAEKHLRAELAINPSHGMANFRQGQILLADNREIQSIPYLEKAMAALPDRVEIRRELGKAFRKAGKLASARAEWEQVERLRPEDDQVHFLLGGLYRELGEATLSASHFNLHRQLLEKRRSRSERR